VILLKKAGSMYGINETHILGLIIDETSGRW